MGYDASQQRMTWRLVVAEDFRFNHETDRPVAVEFEGGMVIVSLADGRTIGNPLDWHPWLRDASREQQSNYELRAFSVDWPDLDDGLDIEGMLRGVRPALDNTRMSAEVGS